MKQPLWLRKINESRRHLKRLLLLCTIAISLSACQSHVPQKKDTIGLRPIGAYDSSQLRFVQQQLAEFYQVPVVLLLPVSMPPGFLNTSKGERYSADSIIAWLGQGANDTLARIVGLTNKDIFTTFRDKDGNVWPPASVYSVWGIMGLGFCPGKACIVSNFRLKNTDEKNFRHRLRTVVIHETGHTMGLPHCPHAGCIMNDARGQVATIDKTGENLCASCRSMLGLD